MDCFNDKNIENCLWHINRCKEKLHEYIPQDSVVRKNIEEGLEDVWNDVKATKAGYSNKVEKSTLAYRLWLIRYYITKQLSDLYRIALHDEKEIGSFHLIRELEGFMYKAEFYWNIFYDLYTKEQEEKNKPKWKGLFD